MGWDFFIRRPIFSAVLSLIIVLVGGLALLNLPLSQYPQIAPPTVTVRSESTRLNSSHRL